MDCDEISTVFSSETDPSFFQNSCTGNSNILDREITHEGAEKKEKKSGEAVNQIRPDDPMLEFSVGEIKGWTIELKQMPKFTEDNLNMIPKFWFLNMIHDRGFRNNARQDSPKGL